MDNNHTRQYRGNEVIKKDVYVIKNRINNKVYVGQAKDTRARFLCHCKPSSARDNSLIDKAIQKYGANNFWFEILEEQVDNYNERERYWIKRLKSIQPNGYNILDGGEDPPTFYGLDSPCCAFESIAEVNAIKHELRCTRKTLQEIADKFGVSKKTVLRINQGISYEEYDEDYPIRKVPNISGTLTEDDAKNIIDILKNTYRQYIDIGNQYGISISEVKNINSGVSWRQENEDYPIRKYKNSGRPACTYQQVTEISELLKTTDISCNQLAKCYCVDLQIIYIINNGNAKRYRRPGYTYPIRKHNPKR